ncbi:MAG: hypothetical protein Q9218_004666, partial [Villophora microphyllina]
MRMSPPAASDPSREVLPGGLSVDNHFFPPGTNVAVMIYALHHNPLVFKDPHVFRPERWLVSPSTTAEDVARAESAFAPFSYGPRACPGKGLAYLELGIVVAKILWGADVKGVAG